VTGPAGLKARQQFPGLDAALYGAGSAAHRDSTLSACNGPLQSCQAASSPASHKQSRAPSHSRTTAAPRSATPLTCTPRSAGSRCSDSGSVPKISCTTRSARRGRSKGRSSKAPPRTPAARPAAGAAACWPCTAAAASPAPPLPTHVAALAPAAAGPAGDLSAGAPAGRTVSWLLSFWTTLTTSDSPFAAMRLAATDASTGSRSHPGEGELRERACERGPSAAEGRCWRGLPGGALTSPA
jgi:hypothetical protein